LAKVAVIGDMHFGVKNGNPDFLEFQLAWLEYCLQKLQAMGVTIIVQTGDMFDTRAHIKLNILHAVMNQLPALLNKYGIETWITYGGNHDMFYRDSNDICSLDILNFMNKPDSVEFKVFTNTIGYELIGDKMFAFVPWVNKNNFEDLINVDLLQGPAEYVFGHFEIVGMPMIPGVLCEHGVEPKDFKRFKRVISGHFHTVSKHLNCTMVGTPYHITWGDVQDGNNRGFWVLDTDTDDFELVKNDDHLTLFSVIEYDQKEKYDDESFKDYEGTIVKVLVKEKADPKHYKKFVDLLAKCKFLDYKIIDTTMVEIEKVEISEEVLSLDTLSAMNAFIDGQSDEMNKDAVKNLAKSIYMEAMSVQ
jgi:DNA repair exonuclease SbcCD nuclease subunit